MNKVQELMILLLVLMMNEANWKNLTSSLKFATLGENISFDF